MRVVKPWPRLPREEVDAPFLEMFKVRLDEALSNLIWLSRCPCSLQGNWTRWPLEVPCNPNYSMILSTDLSSGTAPYTDLSPVYRAEVSHFFRPVGLINQRFLAPYKHRRYVYTYVCEGTYVYNGDLH